MGLIRDTTFGGITEFLTVKYLGMILSYFFPVLPLQMENKGEAQGGD